MINEIRDGLNTAFIDSSNETNLAFKPEFLVNNYEKGQKVLSAIERELLSCESFSISVAFITKGGVTPLLQTLKVLEQKGVSGRILTTDYLMFSEPEALDKLSELKNIELKIYRTEEGLGFHTKGYIFQKEEIYRIIIGSSNLTQSALTVNQEWNTKLVTTDQGEMAKHILAEFNSLWESENSLDYAFYCDEYRTKYEIIKTQRRIASKEKVTSLEAYRLRPNSMQTNFISSLKALVERGETKGLLISATGTGKTYASAFAVRDVFMNRPTEGSDRPIVGANKEKVLFIVHREQIAKQALQTYRKVFGSSVTFGLLSGNAKETDAQFLFSTMQMMARTEIMEQFSPEEFSYIILDEAHKTGAKSYQKIMEYFHPKFWLGMTASPERMDDFDVFALFDHNIAYEIRLQQAMEEDLLCPFHYFGITDLEINGISMDDETGLRDFRYLVCEERVNYILEQASYYGHSGNRVKGLIFCSRAKEAEELSRMFNQRGFRTVFLSGDTPQATREEMMERLTSDDREDLLDYIFTVDIFNEGVDLPEVNQVIMLRPTQSPIIFVQQLGRGLRKANEKEYVVILDFIGNYTNNFMIPIALSGDRSYNKDNVRRYVMEGVRVIPGSSTIHFDEISRKRIFSAIDAANFSDLKLIKENYKNLKYKLGRIPDLMDFDRYGEMDVLRIFDNDSLGSYYKFLVKYEPEYKIRLTKQQEKVIEFISKKLASGKRIHEIELLNRMLHYREGLMRLLRKDLSEQYRIDPDSTSYDNIVNVMTNEFSAGSGKKTYEDCVFLQEDGDDYRVSDKFSAMLESQDFRDMVRELVEFARSRYEKNYQDRYQDTDFVLYQKYTYEDACRLLGWDHNEVPLNIGGYKYDKKTKTFPVFINYDKADDIQDTVKYEDHFVSTDRLIAISKSNRTLQSEDVQNFLRAKERGISVELFVRKNKDDKISKEFYYLGRMEASGMTKEFTMANTKSTAVEIEWILDTPVRSDLYEYIVNG
ncbi:MAG: DEAD/DEAH box helicase [Lachnospiraceae bacterium]|nr:DEAD/DEAH box helicase [Lachnospiraceae bacterium]